MQVFGNPELIRLLRSKLRMRTLLTNGGIAAVVCLGAYVIAYNVSTTKAAALPASSYKYLFYSICYLQLLPLSFYAAQLAAQNITLEKERATYDFQRMVAMGPWNLALGKLLGAPAEAFWMALVAVPFALVAALLGSVPIDIVVKSQAVVFLFGLFASSIGLFCSGMSEKSNQSAGLVFGMGGLLYVVSAIFGRRSLWSSLNPLTVLYAPEMGNAPAFSLFWMEVSSFEGYVTLTALLTILFFLLTARRIADPDLAPLSRKQTLLLFAALQLVIIGSLDLENHRAESCLAEFHGFSLFILTLFAFGLSPSSELLHGRLTRGKPGDAWAILREKSNPLQDSPGFATMLLLCGAYVVLALWQTQSANYWHPQSFGAIAMVALIPLAVNLLITYIQVYTTSGGFKLAFVVLAISQVFPPIAAMILAYMRDMASLMNTVIVSPVAYLVHFASHSGERFYSGVENSPFDVWALPAITACCFAALLLLTLARFRFLIDLSAITQAKERDAERRLVENSPRDVLVARAMATTPELTTQPVESQPK